MIVGVYDYYLAIKKTLVTKILFTCFKPSNLCVFDCKCSEIGSLNLNIVLSTNLFQVVVSFEFSPLGKTIPDWDAILREKDNLGCSLPCNLGSPLSEIRCLRSLDHGLITKELKQ